MAKRCLVVYSSFTGNTGKVAEPFRSTFRRNGWTCVRVKVQKTADDILNPRFDLKE
jgi:flavodoxin